MVAAPPPASRAAVGIDVRGTDARFPYEIDGHAGGAVEVRYPFPLAPLGDALIAAIGAGVALYVGQLCLASTIDLEFEVDPAIPEALEDIAGMLYGIRCWKDERPLVDGPRFHVRAPRPAGARAADLDPGKSVLLFSGGKDSALSALALRRNGFAVHALHATANAGSEGAEARSVERIGGKLGLSRSTLAYRHADFARLSDRYARNWNAFPHHNAVPFGRDLLLALLALPVMLEHGAGTLSMGHDNECRTASVTYGGKTIPRNDIESSAGAIALERYVRRFIAPDVRFLPPVARLTELRILEEMFVHHPEVMAETSFCFWGRSCGRCGKCLRYFLAQRMFERDGTLDFGANPLARGACPELEDILDSWGRRRVLFDKQVIYMLGRLVQRGQVRRQDERLADFAERHFAQVEPELDRWQRGFDGLASDPQVPPGFLPLAGAPAHVVSG